MISNYLKSKNTINQIPSKINERELNLDSNGMFYYLSNSDYSTTYYYYRDLFSLYEIQKIITICNKLPHTDGIMGTSTSILDKSRRNSVISWVNVNEETRWLYQRLTDCILEVNKSFFEYDLTKIEKLQFTRYYGENGGLYCPHIDCNSGYLHENRKLSFVMQLSNPEDYEGGELRLHQGKTPDIIPKEKGLITFFPSHTLHECTPVTSGIRYTLVGWIYGPKFK